MWLLKILPFISVGIFANEDFNTRIIGGQDTNITEVPWQLLHLKNGSFTCGGIIIGPREVLSAGHCYSLGSDNYLNQYRAGSNKKDEGGILYEVESYVVHPEFNVTDDYVTHDIAFVKMKEPFNFSESIQPIKLADKEPEDGAEALISGWGVNWRYNDTTFELPTILKSVRLPVVEREKCREWYSDFYWEVRDDQVCVGTSEGGVGACNGDSGGPMVVNNEVVGITSWGDPCAVPHHPSVYTSIPYYRDWIQEQLDSTN